MGFIIGTVMAVVIGIFASLVGLDRDRAFYPTIMIVIAFYYVLFGVMGGDFHALALESVFAIVFIAASIMGFKHSLWIVAIALAAHGVFDFVHGHIIANPGVPAWWPQFCGAYDVVAAAYLGFRLSSIKTDVVS